MPEGFYYNTYPPNFLGRDPARAMFTVQDQARVAKLAQARVEARDAAIRAAYQRRGLWQPKSLFPIYEEGVRLGVDIFSASPQTAGVVEAGARAGLSVMA
jgi:hypothetical protein